MARPLPSTSHSARVCGLKQEYHPEKSFFHPVTLRASVWIETVGMKEEISEGESHSARVCGLKLTLLSVRPRTSYVTLRASVWIETMSVNPSDCWFLCHTPRECVDWNINSFYYVYITAQVTLRASVWIETNIIQFKKRRKKSHSARVCGLKHVYRSTKLD